jgi:hypothetical protein
MISRVQVICRMNQKQLVKKINLEDTPSRRSEQKILDSFISCCQMRTDSSTPETKIRKLMDNTDVH